MIQKDLATAARGFCMGVADVVPGVSGGTVAFILGIYEKLVDSISNLDLQFAKQILSGKFRDAAVRINLRFLVALGCGIVLGLGVMLAAVGYLLSNETCRPFTLAAFMGMILGSAIVMIRSIKIDRGSDGLSHWMIGIVAMLFAGWIAIQTNPSGQSDPALWYVFLCGAIAICAMILPGISGAMILLLLGIYLHLSDIPHQLKAGENVSGNFVTLIVFGFGCLSGLICFSKILKWLLTNWHSLTLAALCGLMIGSLPKLWPFQTNVTPEIVDFKKATFERIWPGVSGPTLGALAVIVVAMIAVILAETYAGGTEDANIHEQARDAIG